MKHVVVLFPLHSAAVPALQDVHIQPASPLLRRPAAPPLGIPQPAAGLRAHRQRQAVRRRGEEV